MIFFISQAQAIDDVLLMQSIGNVGFNKLRENIFHMCENWFQKIKALRREIGSKQFLSYFAGNTSLWKIGSQKIKQIRWEIGSKHVLTYFAGNTSLWKIGSNKIKPIRREIGSKQIQNILREIRLNQKLDLKKSNQYGGQLVSK